MRNIISQLIAITLFILAYVDVCVSEASTNFPHNSKTYEELVVDKPFSTLDKRKRLVEVFDVSDDFVNNVAKHILLYGHRIETLQKCPSEYICVGHPASDFMVFRRFVRLDITPINEATKNSFLKQEIDACSKLKFKNFNLSYAIDRISHYEVKAEYKKRWCWEGGVLDVATGDASVKVRNTLDIVSPSYDQNQTPGKVSLIPSITVHDRNSKIFGLIDINVFRNILTPASILTGFAVPEIGLTELTLNEINNSIMQLLEKISANNTFQEAALLNSAIKSYIKFSADLQQLQAVDLRPQYLDPENTKFICDEKGCGIELAESTYVLTDYSEAHYETRKCEIETIRKFSEGEKWISVQKGDTLWKIAQRELCSGEMYLYLLYLNPHIKNPDSILVGDTLLVKPLHSFLSSRGSIVKHNDSLWKKYLNSDREIPWREYKNNLPKGSKNSNLIYPLQIITTDKKPVSP